MISPALSVAALNVATGEVLHQTRKRHTGADVLAFFKWIDLHTPAHLDMHVVLDNLSADKSEPVRKWLAHPRRGRWHLHFTPTSSSWANLVEGWFSILARRALNTGLQLRRRTRKHHRTLDSALEPRPPTTQPNPRHTTSVDGSP